MKEEKDWSKATDEELIRKAQTDYKIGTVFESVRDGLECTVNEGFVKVSNDSVYVDGNKVFCCIKNQWAEVIKQPKEASPEAQKDFEANNPGMIFKPEPKAGDMVEVSDNGEDYSKYSHHTHKYLGVKRFYDGFFVVEDQNGFISCHPFIRLPQKSEVESKADEFINEWVEVDETTNMGYIDKMRLATIDLIKWGQQNPTKK